jgi:hypothetical protein
MTEWLGGRKPIEARISNAERHISRATHSDALSGLPGNGSALLESWDDLSPTATLRSSPPPSITRSSRQANREPAQWTTTAFSRSGASEPTTRCITRRRSRGAAALTSQSEGPLIAGTIYVAHNIRLSQPVVHPGAGRPERLPQSKSRILPDRIVCETSREELPSRQTLQ